MDKISWGPGPWQDEPDRLQWTDPATGFVCLIKRGPAGALCGYVGIPPSHRYHGHHYNDIDVEVHWSLSYSAPCDGDPEHGICHVPAPGEPDDLYWLGFDCAHAGDVCPKVDADLKQAIGGGLSCRGDVYRDIAYVRGECERLAAQLASQNDSSGDRIPRQRPG